MILYLQAKKGDFDVNPKNCCLLLRISLNKRIARHSFLCDKKKEQQAHEIHSSLKVP